MTKEILTVGLVNIFITDEPWQKAHELWFENIAKKLNDPSIKDYSKKKDYFIYIDKIMKKLHPELTEEKRIAITRESYFESVYEYITKKPSVIKEEIFDYFEELKNQYEICLISTGTFKFLKKFLKIIGKEDFFDYVEYSYEDEKDDMKRVFERFVENFKIPKLFIYGENKNIDVCNTYGVKCFYFDKNDKEIFNKLNKELNIKINQKS